MGSAENEAASAREYRVRKSKLIGYVERDDMPSLPTLLDAAKMKSKSDKLDSVSLRVCSSVETE